MTHRLPFITKELPGCGGIIKSCPEDFVVDEEPLYLPSGEGDHMYIRFRKIGLNTRQVVTRLAKIINIDSDEIGTAGLKDRDAVTSQWLSAPAAPFQDISPDSIEIPGVTILEHGLHSNKLRIGHLIGNRFKIRIRFCADQALEKAQAVVDRIMSHGMVNFYGEQRFGYEGANVVEGRMILQGEKFVKQSFLRRILISAFQSHLFNGYSIVRLQAGLMRTAMRGDVMKKTERGGLFIAEDSLEETRRLEAGEIVPTGPMVGQKSKAPMWDAMEFEQECMTALGYDARIAEGLRKNRMMGSRRPLLVYPKDISVEQDDGGLILSFMLPKGSFATVLLREVIKPEEDFWDQELDENHD
ncbi:MAG: tRNA pseudouridine(13) synthase TruD [Candidatus Wallbacteria bacterium HGW-Wallbacteria-1]|jgi:tRNA pseudouridine13 synthase|uniref:tRNA pseudouridine synthase D n=1 Tax=Candidatus Wallbacteria bacterium HGW-Wallbacteria-1 TaxID=2013854 RepID=A0A2N1PS88_9BACT|nr:MAG: tRNA pseudouridine(13) synthase TruD [Candidatus Wallbacteria bacterium HGW-Wallbacteria-1]